MCLRFFKKSVLKLLDRTVYFIAPYTMPSFKNAATNITHFWQLAYHHCSQFCLIHVHRKMSLQDNAVILLRYGTEKNGKVCVT
jgi:hypothetical protein